MQISSEGYIGIGLGLLSLAGAGAVVIAPDHTEIGWAMIALAGAGCVMLAHHHFNNWLDRRGYAFLTIAVVLAALADVAFYHFKPAPQLIARGGPAAPATPPSSAPWVTQDEIDTQKKLGRILLVYSPEELLKMWVNRQKLDIYQLNWIKIDYPMSGLPYPETIEKKQYYVVKMPVRSDRLLGYAEVLAYFDPKKWADRLLPIRPGDHVKAICQFEDIEQGDPIAPYNIRPDNLFAYNCDLL
jgi:hypothetical protein